MQNHSLRASWKSQIRQPLQQIFSGAAFDLILKECHAIHQLVLKGRVWVALHMHAGDGNVHTNIPVNSDDYDMLQTAHGAVKRIMALACSLDGVISGEHGIGITKLEFLSDDELAPFAGYKAKFDPHGRFNKGKLLRQPSPLPSPKGRGSDTVNSPKLLHLLLGEGGGEGLPLADLTNAYTPSFGLMGHESLIMQQSDIGAIAASVKTLPAMRQVQTGVFNPRATREFALQPSQQNSGDLAASRGIFARRTNAPRREHQALARV